MPRNKLPVLPEFDGSIKSWATKQISKNFWRFKNLYDREDLLQDAYVKYLQCYRRYVAITSHAHFMSLFKTAYLRHLQDLSDAARTCGTDEIPDQPVYGDEELAVLVEQAPPDVRKLLEALTTPDPWPVRYNTVKRRKGLKVRVTTNQVLCELAGVDPTMVNLVDLTKQHFQPEIEARTQ